MAEDDLTAADVTPVEDIENWKEMWRFGFSAFLVLTIVTVFFAIQASPVGGVGHTSI
jgi:hypothetical protein